MELTATEQRVLGCLIEKEATTPEQYPLSISALVAACNQATNRDPVVHYDDGVVLQSLDTLREKKLIRIVYPAHARVTKYRHALDETAALSPPETAVLAVLMLRGPQTMNELAARTERYADFSDMGGIGAVLARLAGRPEPLVRHFGRRPGQREDRYTHLLGGDRPEEAPPDVPNAEDRTPKSPRRVENGDRFDALEAETANLRREFEQLRELVNRMLSRGTNTRARRMSIVRTPNRSRLGHIRRGRGKAIMAQFALYPSWIRDPLSPFLDGTHILEAAAR